MANSNVENKRTSPSSNLQTDPQSEHPHNLPDLRLRLNDDGGEDPEKGMETNDRSQSDDSLGSGPPMKDKAPLDWSGPDDKENPYNWSRPRRVYMTATTALLSFAITFTSSVYAPAVPEVAERFHVSETAALLGISLYTLGNAFGPVLGAPVSETLGRAVVYRVSIPIFAFFTVGAGFSQTFAQLLVCRFFAGLFGSPVLAVGAGTNADVWPSSIRAVATSAFIMAPYLGPAMGPVAGGFSSMNLGWRWTQWCALFVTVPFYIFSSFQTETYKKIILKRRAKELGIPQQPSPPIGTMLKSLFTVTLLRPLTMLVTEPIVAFLSLHVGFAFAVLFAFFAAFPVVFEGVYGFNTGESGLAFLGISVGVLLGGATAIIIDRKVYAKEHKKAVEAGNAQADPEHRLYAAMLGSVGLPIGLFWFAWTARTDVSYLSPIFAAIPFSWGNFCIMLSASLYLMDSYGPVFGASAMGANGILRYILGASFPLFTVQMYHKLDVHWATTVFGFISILLLPIPFIFYKWGPKIRAYSHYEINKS